MNSNPENILTNQIITYLESQGWAVIRTIPGTIRQHHYRLVGAPKGTSDLICCSPTGHFYAFEIKQGKNKLTKEQQEFQAKIKISKGRAFTIYSMEDILEALDHPCHI